MTASNKSPSREILIKVNGCKTSGEDCFFSKCTKWGCCGLLEKEFEEALDEAKSKQEEVIAEKDKEIEQLRVQLAGCGVAALGYAKDKNDCKKGDYGWSQSFQDVKDLYKKYLTLESSLKVAREDMILKRIKSASSVKDCSYDGMEKK